jgi:butyrate kinase
VDVREPFRVLVLLPGPTWTKVGVFDGEKAVLVETLHHPPEEIEGETLRDQFLCRKQIILDALDREGINLTRLRAVAGPGGFIRPIPGGTYRVAEAMLEEMRSGADGHLFHLGGLLAHEIASPLHIPAFVVDPVTVGMEAVLRLSEIPDAGRCGPFHSLHQQAAARRVAARIGKRYEEMNAVVACLDGEITVGAHRGGWVIDMNGGFDGGGPDAPEPGGGRAEGGLESFGFSGRHPDGERMDMTVGDPGSSKSRDAGVRRGAEERGCRETAYRVAKEIGGCAAVLGGKVDAVVLTGRPACGKMFTEEIVRRVSWIAPVHILPEDDLLRSLAEGALRVLRGEEDVKEYPPADYEKGVEGIHG